MLCDGVEDGVSEGDTGGGEDEVFGVGCGPGGGDGEGGEGSGGGGGGEGVYVLWGLRRGVG